MFLITSQYTEFLSLKVFHPKPAQAWMQPPLRKLQTMTRITNIYLFINNATYEFNENETNDVIFTLLDKSQLIMTIIGVIANVGTSVTLIKNGQVSIVT